MPVYYNTKTKATSDMKESEFNKLPKEVQKRWRPAAESELKKHAKKLSDQKLLDKKQKERVKANEKNEARKASIRSTGKLAPAVEGDKGAGSDDKAESEGSK